MICCFFFNDTATTEIYTLSLHDALPILMSGEGYPMVATHDPRLIAIAEDRARWFDRGADEYEFQMLYGDRKSTRLNSSHANISYAVFCLKKKITRSNTNPSTLLAPPLPL